MSSPDSIDSRAGSGFPSLSDNERKLITVDYLSQLTPGRQEYPVFRQLARLTGLDTVEILPVRSSRNKRGTEVMLIRRPPSDPIWPDLLHPAGSIVLESDPINHDHDFSAALARATAELGDLHFTNGPCELDTIHRRGRRGREITIHFWGETDSIPGAGEFHDANDILSNPDGLGIRPHHAAYIEKVVKHYEQLRS